MQRTRLSTLTTTTAKRLSQWAFNPWRRLSVVIISLLFGYFLGNAISATAGQAARWDITLSALLLAMVELINWLYYRRPRLTKPSSSPEDLPAQRTLVTELLNALKLGLTYSLFVEAFKLGS
ncbi:MAG: DUF565 domain-containing protein [Cyanobacteria bacterium P01_A01_bin.105]